MSDILTNGDAMCIINYVDSGFIELKIWGKQMPKGSDDAIIYQIGYCTNLNFE